MSQIKLTHIICRSRSWLLLGIFILLCVSSGLPEQNRTKLGNSVFLQEYQTFYRQQRLGLVINQTSKLNDERTLVLALMEKGARIQAIFSPEHGFTGLEEAGEKVSDSRFQNIKIYSLYGGNRKPTPDQMQNIDAFVYDIQDVGTRFYTYITTLKYVMEAAAQAGIPVYVLDRPNPAGGEVVEGPLLQPEHTSFIGALPIPIRYGLTIGELALMMRGEAWVPSDLDLHIIKMQHWQRDFFWQDTGITWIPTSPNIPSPEAAQLYSGTGLLGGIILNQGYGTDFQFRQIGAPWMAPKKVLKKMETSTLKGMQFEFLEYTPRAVAGKSSDPPYKDRLCRGFRIKITQREALRPLAFALELVRILKRKYPKRIYQKSEALTLMYGNDMLSGFLKGDVEFQELMQKNLRDEELFKQKRKKYLLY